MLESLLVDLKGNVQAEDRLPGLDGHHAPGGKALAVANPVHFVKHGFSSISRAHEVAVQGVRRAPVHRHAGGSQGLRQNLPAKEAEVTADLVRTKEKILLDTFQIQHFQQPRRAR